MRATSARVLPVMAWAPAAWITPAQRVAELQELELALLACAIGERVPAELAARVEQLRAERTALLTA